MGICVIVNFSFANKNSMTFLLHSSIVAENTGKNVGLNQLLLKNRVMCVLFVPGVAEGESVTKLYVHLIDKWGTGENP